jgi:hypothetical protein
MQCADGAAKRCNTALVKLSNAVASTALILAAVLVIGHAGSEDAIQPVPPKETMQGKISDREAQRRAAMAEQQKRKEEFQRRCGKPVKTPAELEECRLAYRKL